MSNDMERTKANIVLENNSKYEQNVKKRDCPSTTDKQHNQLPPKLLSMPRYSNRGVAVDYTPDLSEYRKERNSASEKSIIFLSIIHH